MSDNMSSRCKPCKNDSKCPKCDEELEWDSGSTMEWEEWYCAQCDQLYEVDVELVRFWDTLTEKE